MAGTHGTDGTDGPDPTVETDARRALRAQLLATEHWSLLASRSTTQSEILSRVTIFLTLVSAGLVTLGLLGQLGATDPDHAWTVPGVLAFLVLVGLMTQVRVVNAMTEDLMYVLAMNRLRGAYVDLDPPLARHLMASPFDDELGVRATYNFLGSGTRSHVFGSLGVFVQAINAVLIGLLVGAVLVAAGAAMSLAAGGGVAAAVATAVIDVRVGYRRYVKAMGGHQPARPTPEV